MKKQFFMFLFFGLLILYLIILLKLYIFQANEQLKNGKKLNLHNMQLFKWKPTKCAAKDIFEFTQCANNYLMTPKEHKRLLYLLYLVDNIFNHHSIPYFAGSGTLLAIKRHRGFLIPYDDDIDLHVPDKYRPRVIRALNEVANETFGKYGSLCYGNKPYTMKIFFPTKHCHIQNNAKFCWPFVDILFYEPSYNGMHKLMMDDTRFNASWANPLERSSLEGVGVWIPNNWKYFLPWYNLKECCVGVLSHKKQRHVSCSKCVKCQCLKNWLHLDPDVV